MILKKINFGSSPIKLGDNSSIKVTVDIYGHLVPGGNKAAVDRLDNLPTSSTFRNLSATNI